MVANGTRTDLAKVGVGVFVKRGAAKPDISTVETFKRATLNAKSVGYNDPAAGAPVSLYLIDLFQRLGISAELTAKTVVFKQRSERFDAVARGDVELGFNQISEIVSAPGVELVGPLPASIQRFTVFAAGIVASSKEPKAAMDFVRFIGTPETGAVWKSKGFEAP
jgi:molybdate transport system substrate-binding protein